jgi:hypothetical protein
MYSLLSQADLDARLGEMAILRGAYRGEAPYACAQLSAIAASVGVSNSQIEGLTNGRSLLDFICRTERSRNTSSTSCPGRVR